MNPIQQIHKTVSSSSLQYSSLNNTLSEFEEPSKLKRFSLRKRRISSVNDDNISVLSLDVNALQGGKKRRLSRVASLASLISPAKQIKRMTKQRSTASVTSPIPRYRSPNSENTNRRISRRSTSTPNTTKRSRQWLEKFPREKQSQLKEKMSYWELCRQEAIYELYKGEKYMVKDLELVRQTYQGSMQCLGILQPEESQRIFGPLHTLLPVHQDLRDKLRNGRLEDKSTFAIGQILHDWVSQLEAYSDYCSHLVAARETLERRRSSCKDLATFLDLCRQSDFSRRLDLWSFLDVPRSKLTKYPLLLKNILKHTSEKHEDRELLPKVIDRVEDIVQAVDRNMGKTICRLALNQIHGLDPQKDCFLLDATSLLCQGELRNNRGTKLQGFLFNTGFILTRPLQDKFCVYKRPIAAFELQLVESATKSSSFKSAFSSSSGHNISFCISNSSGEQFILSANDEHDHKEWIQKLKSVSASVTPLKERN